MNWKTRRPSTARGTGTGSQTPSPSSGMSPASGVWIGSLRDLVERVVGFPLFKHLVNWSRIYSLWPVHLTTACCSAEFGAMMSGRYDPERFGMQAAVGSMRQSDLLIIEGTVTKKMLKRIKVIWEQICESQRHSGQYGIVRNVVLADAWRKRCREA